jgi:hypothetical protein
MANSPNFNWELPDDTDLVKDGAAAMRTLGNSIDSSFVDLKGGTTGQVLAKNSNTDLDFVWTAPTSGDIEGVTAGVGISGGGTSGTVTVTNSMATAIDAKGDLIVGTGADTFSRWAVGTNDYVLTAASGETTGLKWAAIGAPAFAGCSLKRDADLTLSNATLTSITFNQEDFDTDAFHSTTSNTDRITIPSGKAGKYLLTGTVQFNVNGTGRRYVEIRHYIGGVLSYGIAAESTASASAYVSGNISIIANASVGDYFTLSAYQSSGGNLDILYASSVRFYAGLIGA